MISNQIPDLLHPSPVRASDIVKPWAQKSPDSVALVEATGTWSYSQLWAAIGQTQIWLESLGTRPGDRVMVVCENCRASRRHFPGAGSDGRLAGTRECAVVCARDRSNPRSLWSATADLHWLGCLCTQESMPSVTVRPWKIFPAWARWESGPLRRCSTRTYGGKPRRQCCRVDLHLGNYGTPKRRHAHASQSFVRSDRVIQNQSTDASRPNVRRPADLPCRGPHRGDAGDSAEWRQSPSFRAIRSTGSHSQL